MSQNYSTIQVGSYGYLDLKEDVNAPFNFSFAEIQDISKRKGGFSKTIIAPGTANNIQLLGFLFNVNIVDSSFQLGKKEPCIILQNGIPILQNAYLQLLSVNKRSDHSPIDDGTVEFEVAIKDDIADFFSALDGKYLTDIDFSSYNHKKTWTGITATQFNTWKDVYHYELYRPEIINYYTTKDFNCSIYSLAYLTRIISEAGYSFEWPDLEDCLFDKTVIPYNGDRPEMNLEDLETYKFKAFLSAQTSNIVLTTGNTSTGYQDLVFNNEEYDNDSAYSTVTGKYAPNQYGTAIFQTKFYYEVYLQSNVPVTAQTITTTGSITTAGLRTYTVRQSLKYNPTITDPDGITASNIVAQFGLAGNGSLFPASTLNSGLNLKASGYTTELITSPTAPFAGGFNIYSGFEGNNVLKGEYQHTFANIKWVDSAGTEQYPQLIIKVGNSASTQNYFTIQPSLTDIADGSTVYLNNYIPKKILQKDFFSDIVKLYNLYITFDKDKTNHLIIKTRDRFFDDGATQDIHYLLDEGQDYSIQFLPDLQKKELIFKYKDGGDYWNKSYVEKTNESYGQHQHIFDNDFANDKQVIDLKVFEPAPLDFNSTVNYIPVTSHLGRAPKTGLRILYKSDYWIGVPNGNPWLIRYQSGGTQVTQQQFTYPYAGHFYNSIDIDKMSIDPTDDLNFGLNDYYFYNTWTQLTNNNQFNKYYYRYINQIENGKLLTGYFKLDEEFILNLQYDTKYYINGTYWTLNQIINYNLNGNGLTKCEFISVDDSIRFNSFKVRLIKAPSIGEAIQVIDDPRYNSGNGGNTIIGPIDTTNTVRGYGNFINNTVTNASVLGNNNRLSNTDSTSVIGSGNTVTSTKSIILGDDNTVNNSGILVVGDNITASTKGLYTENLYIKSGGTLDLSGVNIISDNNGFSFGTNGKFGYAWYNTFTTGNTPTVLLFNNQSKFKIPVGYAFYCKISVVAESTNAAKQWYGEGLIKNNGGTTSLVGSFTMTSTFGDAALATASVAVTANNTDDTLDITATGIIARDINWFAKVDFVTPTQ